MQAALALAARGLGRTWPNPTVGCVLVRPDLNGRIVGRGWTQPGGRPHAETEALARAGALARGATAYVTLEPCAHHGRTPPCADALIEAGIGRAVIALEDPDPRVSGAGIARLEAAGVAVTLGVGAEAATEINAGFLLRIREGRPLATLKIASSLDGRIATRTGESRWITGEAARRHGHALRLNHDAILIGIGTALADDPELTCRLPGSVTGPVRIVVDSKLRLSPDSRLAATARDVPTWVVTTRGSERTRAALLEAKGIEVVDIEATGNGRVDLVAAFDKLAARGLTRILVEGGGAIAAALLSAGLIDRVAWFRAPVMLGGDGISAVAGIHFVDLATAPGFVRTGTRALGADTLETFRRLI